MKGKPPAVKSRRKNGQPLPKSNPQGKATQEVFRLRHPPTVVPVSAGGFSAGAPDLNDPKAVREIDKLQYNPGETLFSFLQNNAARERAKKEVFLTTTVAGDSFVEFTVDSNNNPVQPRDPRYQFMTSQPYASSSYGFLQLTLLPFDQSPKGLKLTAAFNPSATPIYQLMTLVGKNFDLAAHFNQITFSKTTPLCGSTNCNESLWEKEWAPVIQIYNSSTKNTGYGAAVVKSGVDDYAPSEPQ